MFFKSALEVVIQQLKDEVGTKLVIEEVATKWVMKSEWSLGCYLYFHAPTKSTVAMQFGVQLWQKIQPLYIRAHVIYSVIASKITLIESAWQCRKSGKEASQGRN